MIVLAMAISLTGCKKSDDEPAGSLGTIEIGQAEPKEDMDASDDGAISDDVIPVGSEILFPEYEDYIDWYFVPNDYVGGFGSGVEPEEGGTGVVNVRERPSIDADVIAQLTVGGDEWWVINETYGDEDGFFIGSYNVPNGDYTWTLIASWDQNGNIKKMGWVAKEVVQFWGV